MQVWFFAWWAALEPNTGSKATVWEMLRFKRLYDELDGDVRKRLRAVSVTSCDPLLFDNLVETGEEHELAKQLVTGWGETELEVLTAHLVLLKDAASDALDLGRRLRRPFGELALDTPPPLSLQVVPPILSTDARNDGKR